MYSGSRAAAYSRTAARQPARAVRAVAATGGDHVADQPLVARGVLADDHRRLGHPRAAGQHRLHLARLDPEPADLHLVIGPPGEHQLPARPSTAPGPRSGTSAPRPPRTGTPRTAPRSAPAAPGTRAPARPRRCTAPRPPPPAPGPATRPARTPGYWRPAARSAACRTRRRIAQAVDVHRRLGRPVQVVQHPRRTARRTARPASPAAPRRRTAPAAGAALAPGTAWPMNASSIDGTNVHGRDPRPADQPRQVPRILRARPAGPPPARAPASNGHEQLPHRHVEADRRLLQHPVTRAQPVPRLHPRQPGSRSRHAGPPPPSASRSTPTCRSRTPGAPASSPAARRHPGPPATSPASCRGHARLIQRQHRHPAASGSPAASRRGRQHARRAARRPA